MKYFLPRSLAGRTLLILCIGLTLSNMVSILVFTSEKMEHALPTSEQQLLERMATLVHILCDTPTALHAPILSAMNRDGVPIDIIHAPDTQQLPQNGRREGLRQALEKKINRPALQVLWVQSRAIDWNHPFGTLHHLLFWIEIHTVRAIHPEVIEQEWHVLVQLDDHKHILLISHPAGNPVPLFRHASLSVLIMSVATLLLVLLMVRLMTRSWEKMLQAAEPFGQDLYAEPLPEQGATEIVRAVQIFNRMNRRIRGFVDEQLQIISAISQDSRTPLTQLRLMAESTKTAEERRHMLNILDEMEKMSAATLSFARNSVSIEPKHRLNLSGLLVAICRDMADAGALIHSDEMATLPYFCQPVAMKRALINLIDNAVQYGGCAEVDLTTTHNAIIIQIWDPGVGIPEPEWKNVTQPFYRLEPARHRHPSGVGMGLAIAHSVLHDHEGKIQFNRPAAGGFIVQVRLPSQQAHPP